MYRVVVTAKISNLQPGKSEIEVKTNLPPYGGKCKVDPSQGNIQQISCIETFKE